MWQNAITPNMTHLFSAPPIPNAFIWRRAHSLTGLWLVLFLMEHLFTNSQAALLIGDDGNGFVNAVNVIKNLPYLPFIEICLLAIPLTIHAIWGVRYLFTAKYNVLPSDGSSPSLPNYRGNKAYTWQRITSWILLFGILAHVIQMRFINYPVEVKNGAERFYVIRLSKDEGLYSLSKRLGFSIVPYEQVKNFVKWLPENNQLFITSQSFGTVELLLVRDTFKNPLMLLLYTGLVLAACFHAFNGLWTFMITWGITLTERSQQCMRLFAIGLMTVISFMGLAAIWGTYWINLTH